eukprot:Phypoly_transcript_25405.p1 GENE.Phypoly_transcript_25405~~Phypoly_transcript_25405.p1  ORF type:complete len:100 (+),score=17.76 Phypoly_transcript_25405:3-302(+)
MSVQYTEDELKSIGEKFSHGMVEVSATNTGEQAMRNPVFSGEEAVLWLQNNVQGVQSIEEAQNLGTLLLKRGFYRGLMNNATLENRKIWYVIDGKWGAM